MKFSELKNKLSSFSCSSADEFPSSTLKEIEEKYLGDIHGGSNEPSPDSGFLRNILWKLSR